MISGVSVSAVINCAGRGERFGGDKLAVLLAGAPVIVRTVHAIAISGVDEIIIPSIPSARSDYQRMLKHLDLSIPVRYVDGGDMRHQSVLHGAEVACGDFVLSHDGVRPFVTSSMIERVVNAATKSGAAMLGVPSSVQVKLVQGGIVQKSLDRSQTWMGQTPQVFERQLLVNSLRAAAADGYALVSDDADIVAAYGAVRVAMVEGAQTNIKVTFPEDLRIAEAFLEYGMVGHSAHGGAQ